ncbi:pyridine nucleotide-disulfide oxidoreductase domain-containing protein 1 isoform X1 [Drosophila teissieri]|uniref:pyridine nucleotide-disulfide oxidoreductase domain-containing protein 1 isoform X1 n=1 Tax=Drosophila teissieri TaxID=7243 RepID=UPI001CB9D93E|nr:pyridine nucleotide-disulfide oxidoreductase domain-containing protein 1 isoform X1 [Drosophila teissieri]
MSRECEFLVIGGGIAGVSCAESLAICRPNASILLLTESSIVKSVTNLVPVARYLHKFDVREQDVSEMGASFETLVDQLDHISSSEHCIRTKAGVKVKYRYLCLCTGGRPKLFCGQVVNPLVIGIRDTDSVLQLQRKLTTAKDIMILGNGGIASELAYELKDINVHWVVKDSHISATFVDPGAAEFFHIAMNEFKEQDSSPATAIKRMRYSEVLPKEQTNNHGAALGPDWHRTFDLSGSGEREEKRLPKIYYKSRIHSVQDLADRTGVIVKLEHEDGSFEQLTCDFIVSATGVLPNTHYTCDSPLEFSPDGGICVDEMMRTNLVDVFAAGDVCTANWPAAMHWFQMRLWTQARQMGSMAGRSMAAASEGECVYQDFCFELFGHVTKLFGYPVVLLGRFNGQGLGRDYEILVRCTRNKEYIKFVLQNGRLRGAMLIGNNDLAETCENLILNGIDLEPYGDDILNPDIDIEDYFD